MYIDINDERNLVLIDPKKREAIEMDKMIRQMKSISHFTRLENAISIIETSSFWAFALSNQKTENKFSLDKKVMEFVYTVSLANIKADSEEFWSKFKNIDCRMDFFFLNSLDDGFLSRHPFECYTDEGVFYIDDMDKRYTSLASNSVIPGVCIKQEYVEVEYTEEYRNKACFISAEDNTTYFSHDLLSKAVRKEFDYQKEIRMNLKLHSVGRTIPMISKVIVPFDKNSIESIIITLKEYNEENRQLLQRIEKRNEVQIKLPAENNNCYTVCSARGSSKGELPFGRFK